MVFWDLPGWGLGSVDMDTPLCNSSLQSTFSSWLWSSSESFPFCWVLFLVRQGCFCFVESCFRFRIIVFSFMLRVWSFVVLYRYTHDVLIGSFSDMIFYLSIVTFSLGSEFYISCVDACYAFDMVHLSLTSRSLWPDLSWRILSLST